MKLSVKGKEILLRRSETVSERRKQLLRKNADPSCCFTPATLRDHDVDLVEKPAHRVLNVNLKKLAENLPSTMMLREVFPGVKPKDIPQHYHKLPLQSRMNLWERDLQLAL